MDKEQALELLGLDKIPNKKQLKKVYRQLAKETHPDISKTNKSTHFLQIKQAYDLVLELMNKQKLYNKHLKEQKIIVKNKQKIEERKEKQKREQEKQKQIREQKGKEYEKFVEHILTAIKKGSPVTHKQYGEGKVISIDKRFIVVKFGKEKKKFLLGAFLEQYNKKPFIYNERINDFIWWRNAEKLDEIDIKN